MSFENPLEGAWLLESLRNDFKVPIFFCFSAQSSYFFPRACVSLHTPTDGVALIFPNYSAAIINFFANLVMKKFHV